MSDYDWMCFLNQDQAVTPYTFNLLSTGTVSVVPGNANRRRLILPASPTQVINYAFDTFMGQSFQLTVGSNLGAMVLTWDMIGDLIVHPVIGYAATSNQAGFIALDVAVHPARWAVYQRYLNDKLAKLGAL